MSIDEFRDWLELGTKYKSYGELKRNILVPVQKELEGKALCWFNCKEKSFEKREGKVVIGINWKVITPEFEQESEIRIESIRNLLRVHFGFKSDDLLQLEKALMSIEDFGRFNMRILEINTYIKENKNKIGNPKAYLIKCIKKEFDKSEK